MTALPSVLVLLLSFFVPVVLELPELLPDVELVVFGLVRQAIMQHNNKTLIIDNDFFIFEDS